MSLQIAGLEQALIQIAENPDQMNAWAGALSHAAIAEDDGAFQTFLVMMSWQNRNRVDAIVAMAADLATRGQTDSLKRLTERQSPACTALCRALLAQHHYLMDYDPDRAYGVYDSTLRGFPFADSLSAFSPAEISSLKTHLAQRLLTPLLGVEPLTFTHDAPPPDDKADIPVPPAGDLLVLAACDDAYARLYAQPFLAAVTNALPSATVLVHIINPTPEGKAHTAALRQTYPRACFSFETAAVSRPYYAARRFMLAEILRRNHWRGDLLILDVDESPTPAFAEVVTAIRAEPLVLWQTRIFDRTVSGIYERVVFLRHDAPLADRFLALAGRYFRKKQALKQEFWGWDGFALFHALCGLGPERQVTCDLKTLYPALFAEVLLQIDRHDKTGTGSHLAAPEIQALLRNLLTTRFDPAVTPQPFVWFLHNP